MSILVDRFFARKDYEGMTEEAAKKLKEERSKIAKELRAKRQSYQAQANEMIANAGGKSNKIAKAEKIRNSGYKFAMKSADKKAAKARNRILMTQTPNLPSVIGPKGSTLPGYANLPAVVSGSSSNLPAVVEKEVVDKAAGLGSALPTSGSSSLTSKAANPSWWGKLSKASKAGVIGAGAVGAGLAGYGIAKALGNSEDEDRSYSYVNSNNMYNVRRFSMEDEARARREARRGTRLQDSHRGLGRSLFLGGLPGAAGGYISKGGVDEDYENGLSESEIVNNASRRGAKWGAGIGGSMGLLGGTAVAAVNPRNAVAPITYGSYGAIRGGLGGYFGAKKNARTRLDKPRIRNYE